MFQDLSVISSPHRPEIEWGGVQFAATFTILNQDNTVDLASTFIDSLPLSIRQDIMSITAVVRWAGQ